MRPGAWYLIAVMILIAVYIFSSGGFTLATICGYVGYVCAGMGFLAFVGGMRKAGAVVFLVGILIANLPALFR